MMRRLRNIQSISSVLKMAATLTVVVSTVGCDMAPGSETGVSRSRESASETIDAYPLLPLDELMAQPSYRVPQISPDGKYISYIAPLEGVSNLFVADVDRPTEGRPVTNYTSGDGVRATDVSGQVMYRWHYDSKSILYPKDYAGDENWDIHIVNVETSEDRNLTPLPDKIVQVIAYGRAKPDEALVSVGTFGLAQPSVYHLDMKTGERTLVQENDGFLSFFGDNDLRVRLGLKFTAAGSIDIQKPDPEVPGEWTSIYEITSEDIPALSASGHQKIIRVDARNENVFFYDSRGRNTAALVSFSLETGETRVIAQDERVDLGGIVYHPVTTEVQGYATNWTRREWHVLDEGVAADFEALSNLAEGDWRIEGRSDDNSKWIVQYMLTHKPTAHYLYDQATKTGARLFVETPQLEGLKLSKLHPYVVRTEDGFDLVSYVILPPWTDPDEDGRPDKPVPVVVLVHGGPSDERAEMGFGPLLHWLANRGYATLYVNFRGSAGFGKKYMNAQKLEWGGKMHQDVLDQVDWAVAEGIADPDKVSILGGSYGGYEVLVAMTMTPDVFACGVDIVGPSNLEIFMPHWDEDRMGKTIGDPRTEEGRAFLRSRSPINFAHQTKNPVLIGQGANDSRVPQEQSDTVIAEMQEAGVEVTYLVYPDEGHGFLRQENRNSFNAIMEVFLSECLGGRREEITTQIEGSSVQVPVGAEHIPGLPEALAARKETGLPSNEIVKVLPAILERYAGDYRLVQYDLDIKVEWTGEQLMFQISGQEAAELFPTSETEFFFKAAPSTVTFFVDDDGSVSHLVLYSQGSENRANRVDKKR